MSADLRSRQDLLISCTMVYRQGDISLHLVSSLNGFAWYLIFVDTNNTSFHGILMLEVRWRLRIDDAEASINFWNKLYHRSPTMETWSVNLQPHDNWFVELANCSEKKHWVLPPKWNMDVATHFHAEKLLFFNVSYTKMSCLSCTTTGESLFFIDSHCNQFICIHIYATIFIWWQLHLYMCVNVYVCICSVVHE